MSNEIMNRTDESRELRANELTSQHQVVTEKVYEQRVCVQKRVMTEDTVEDVYVVPRKVVSERVIEEPRIIREKIIEVAKPQYVEKIVEVPHKVTLERVKEVPVVQYQETFVDVPQYIEKEVIHEVPQIEYREIAVEKLVDVVEFRDEIVSKEIVVDQYVTIEHPEYRDIPSPAVTLKYPIGVKAAVPQHFYMPKMKPKYKKVPMPIYAPRFVEVPVPASFMSEEQAVEAAKFSQCMNTLAENECPSLSQIEKLAEAAKNKTFSFVEEKDDLAQVLQKQVDEGRLRIDVKSQS
eukprot:GHVO01035740.1.p1 GENE.GHVO01035740.1~~GHVO01035740.1.p1  ORF type:complete len:293 (+),score=62.00 GHVO01035740.1:38-916(+)